LLKKQKEELEENIKELKEEVEKFEKFEEVNKNIEKLTEQIEEIKKKGNEKYAERQTLQESIETLQESDGDCPTCGKEMDKKHKKKEIKSRKNKSRS